MDNYTMTFIYDGDFDLPDNPDIRDKKVPGLVLDKMEHNGFELVDFNLSENYDRHNIEHYIADPQLHRSVVEIRLDLTMREMKTREGIYKRCLQAMKQDELCLSRADENDDKQQGMLQSIIVFDMKSRHSASA